MRKWKDVYSENDAITLNDDNIAYCVKALQPFHLIRSGDVLVVCGKQINDYPARREHA
jgi:type I restriction enzyme M protein